MNVVSLPYEIDKKKVDSRFRIVEAVSKRARQLYNGALPKIASNATKLTTVALQEILSSSVCVLSGEEAVKAKEKAEKLAHKIDESEEKVSPPEENLTELEKDLKAYLHKKKGLNNKLK
jgi:DNA-directed RNA polymerase subunit K/omega